MGAFAPKGAPPTPSVNRSDSAGHSVEPNSMHTAADGITTRFFERVSTRRRLLLSAYVATTIANTIVVARARTTATWWHTAPRHWPRQLRVHLQSMVVVT